MTEYEELMALIRETDDLLEKNHNPDGSVRFDKLRGRMALEFALTEIQKSIRKYQNRSKSAGCQNQPD